MRKNLITSVLTGFILVWSLVSSSFVFAEGEIEYRFERLWPRLQKPWYFNGPSDIAIASDGSVYVADTENHRIQQFNARGDFIRTWGIKGSDDGQFDSPKGIAIAPDGSVYVADSENDRIQQFNAQGDFIRAWGSLGSSDGQFFTPNGIAIAPDGSVYITDSARVQQFNDQGGFIRTWGSQGSGDGQFSNPEGIAIASDGSIYVADTFNHRVQQFSAQGDFIQTWGEQGFEEGELFFPRDIAIALDGSVYVASNGIQQFSAQGDFIRAWGKTGSDDEQLNSPKGIATASDGSVYIADTSDDSIKQFSAKGDFIQKWGIDDRGDGQLNGPEGIAIASDGSVYVADTLNSRIQQFSAQGDFVRAWGGLGDGTGEFFSLRGIAIGLDGSIYTTETLNHRIQQFNAEGGFIRTWGGEGSGDGEFEWPDGIAIGSDGSVYVVDSLNHRIQQFTAFGDFIRSWGSEGAGAGQFKVPKGIAIASDGSVYVSDFDRVQQFSAQGDFIRTWGSSGSGDGQFSGAHGITIASDGSVYVVDSSNNRIQQFTAQGDFIRVLGSAGSGDGQFIQAQDMAIASNGDVYVADTGNHRIQKFVSRNKIDIAATTPGSVPITHPYKAIILAGGGKTIAGRPNHIWDGTKRVTLKAYEALTRQAFTQHEEILFLTAGSTEVDLDNNDQFDDLEVASKENLRLAITQWAVDAKDVVIYLANHGGPGKFQVNDSEILTGEELNAWVTQLEQVIPGKVTVIIEACNSAGFFPHLSKPDRYLFASAKANQPAVISNNGLTSFSYYFWSEVATGAHLQPAFETARQGMSKTIVDTLAQDAQAETDGNQVFNNLDLTNLSDYCLGNCNQTAAAAPNISPISPGSRTLNGETAQDFTMTVNHLQPLDEAWALVQRPDDISIDPDKPLNFEKINLSCDSQDVCQGRYERFDLKGEYRISFYAMDENKDVSFPETLIITQTQGKSVIPTEYDDQQTTVYLRDVIVDGQHLQAALELQGSNFVVSAFGEATGQYSPAAQFDAASGKLIIPHALVFGKEYQATFNYVGNLAFELESVTPK